MSMDIPRTVENMTTDISITVKNKTTDIPITFNNMTTDILITSIPSPARISGQFSGRNYTAVAL